ncbi:hypothetical protein HYPSUDRAFT_217556 [Hypholoma sublateritium FD-334 SS-4]|uniref:Uncharacterized protein n=1 Tax=Hypholoma sublateritium (strain FD-334 SS-4) TaxID=945553 RepID=A0A0D2PHT7_HYPSF|nr:hypothetical protein HYPSUDRAFT_217556 [Hypholoma sublateritium FD-334 SS-4]
MKLQHVISLSAVIAGTLISASGFHLTPIGAFSLLLAIAVRIASGFIPFTFVGAVIFLSSTPASAAENYKKETHFAGSDHEYTNYIARVAGGDPQLNVVAAMGATVPKAPGPQDFSGSIAVNALKVLHADVSASHGQHGQQVSANGQVDIPLPMGDGSKMSLGARTSEYFPKGAGSQSFHDDRAHAALEFNKNLPHGGALTFRGGAEFPRGGDAQPFVGVQYRFPFN